MIKAIILLITLTFTFSAQAETRLLMLDGVGCIYCEMWTEQVGDAYHKTDEGRRAPLMRQDIHADLPEGVEITSAAVFTPTFILLVDGKEANRITGYPGEDFFWWMLNNMLNELPEPEAEAEQT